MLKKRLIGAAAVLTPISILLWLDDRSTTPGVWVLPLVIVAGVIGSCEVVDLMKRGQLSVHRIPVVLGSLCLLAAASMRIFFPFPEGCPIGPWGAIASASVVAIWIIILDEMRRFQGAADVPGGVVTRISLEVMSILYVGLPICFLLQLRLLHPNRLGLLAVVSVILVVKVADSGAYFAGKSLGKHKMAPVLSPKKTWEGAVGAMVSAMAVSALFLLFGIPQLCPDAPSISLLPALGYGATLAIVGMLGDLGESLIKRDVQQKDSARWLPGLGGVLDMLDSLLLAGPVGYLFWAGGILS